MSRQILRTRRLNWLVLVAPVAVVLAILAAACGGSSGAAPGASGTAAAGGSNPGVGGVSGAAGTATNWQVQSTAFEANGTIPKDHTCDGADRSPPLTWTPAPQRSVALALILHDPDASGDFTHWVVYNLPSTLRGIEAGASSGGGSTAPAATPAGSAGRLPTGAVEGKNDFGKSTYGGPCPPRGAAHRYVFDFYALDQRLTLDPGATKAQVQQALMGHIVAQTQLVGRYMRA